MTAVEPEVRPLIPLVSVDPAVDRLARICPYLAASDGAWRSASVAREHRCGAVTPAAPLAAEKQRRLCLTDQHLTCATFEAARAARPIGPERSATLPRPLARTTPVVLDHGRIAISVPTMSTDRPTGQAILILLMALAFVAIILAKVSGGSGPAVVGGGPASPGATAGTTVEPSVPASLAATTAPATSSVPSTRPDGSTTPSGSAGHTYKVQPGDTLIGIAARFGTTPKALSLLNGITNPSSLKIGQTLKIP